MEDQNLCNMLDQLRMVLSTIDGFPDRLVNNEYSKGHDLQDASNPDVSHIRGAWMMNILFGFFESYFEKSKWSKYIDPYDLKLLKAYRHVQECMGQGIKENRLKPINKPESDDFEYAINNGLFPKNAISVDPKTNTITLKESVVNPLRDLMDKIAQDVISKCS